MSSLFGTDTLNSLKLGSQNISTAYLGDQLVYTTAQVVPAVTWSPDSLTGLQCWLDAADNDTIYDNDTGRVGQWVDKSGSGHNFSQSLVTQQPLHSNSSIVFDGTDRLSNSTIEFDDAYIWGDTTTGHSVFVVAKSTGDDVSRLLCSPVEPRFFFGGGTTAGDNNFIVAYGNTARNYHSTNVLTPVTSLSSTNILGVVNTQDTQTTPYVNGSSLNTINGEMLAFTGLNIGAGSYSTVDGTWNGVVNEIVIFNRQLDSTDRNKVEGYLAHKWGLTQNLPSDHPYKSSSPV